MADMSTLTDHDAANVDICNMMLQQCNQVRQRLALAPLERKPDDILDTISMLLTHMRMDTFHDDAEGENDQLQSLDSQWLDYESWMISEIGKLGEEKQDKLVKFYMICLHEATLDLMNDTLNCSLHHYRSFLRAISTSHYPTQDDFYEPLTKPYVSPIDTVCLFVHYHDLSLVTLFFRANAKVKLGEWLPDVANLSRLCRSVGTVLAEDRQGLLEHLRRQKINLQQQHMYIKPCYAVAMNKYYSKCYDMIIASVEVGCTVSSLYRTCLKRVKGMIGPTSTWTEIVMVCREWHLPIDIASDLIRTSKGGDDMVSYKNVEKVYSSSTKEDSAAAAQRTLVCNSDVYHSGCFLNVSSCSSSYYELVLSK